jgi:hypothetical protein
MIHRAIRKSRLQSSRRRPPCPRARRGRERTSPRKIPRNSTRLHTLRVWPSKSARSSRAPAAQQGYAKSRRQKVESVVCAFSPWTHNSERVGRRRSPLQLGPALAPALTRCLSPRALRLARITTAGIQRAPELSRNCRGSSSLDHSATSPLSTSNAPHSHSPTCNILIANEKTTS